MYRECVATTRTTQRTSSQPRKILVVPLSCTLLRDSIVEKVKTVKLAMRVLVGVKRAVDYATKVRVLPDKTGFVEFYFSGFFF